ncbi:MAG: metallophosphoesterase [Planctomycetota bacterium]
MSGGAAKLRRWLYAAVVLAAWFAPVFPDPPLHSGAYVQRVTETSAVVARIEPEAVVRALTVRDGSGAVVHRATAAARRRHAFAVAGLRPETPYAFEVLDAAGVEVDRGVFRTAPAPGVDGLPLRFAVVGDSGALPWWVWVQRAPLFWFAARNDWLPARGSVTEIGRRMAADEPHLWLHTGDAVYSWGRHAHYAPAFFRPFAALLRRSPCYLVVGNHDLYDDEGRQAFRNLHLPEGEHTGDERLYTFAWGPVRFVAVDLNQELHSDHATLDHLKKSLGSAEEPWRVVFGHQPILSSSRQGDRPDLKAYLWPALKEMNVDVVFFGHDHNYQRFGAAPGEPLLVVTGGGGKSVYELKDDARVAASYQGYHYTRVDVTGRTMVLTAVALDGREVDRFELDLQQAAARKGVGPSSSGRDLRVQRLLK